MPLIQITLIRRLNVFQATAKEIAADFDREVTDREVLSVPQFAPSNALKRKWTFWKMTDILCRLNLQSAPM